MYVFCPQFGHLGAVAMATPSFCPICGHFGGVASWLSASVDMIVPDDTCGVTRTARRRRQGPQAVAKKFCEVTAVQTFAVHVAHGQHTAFGVPQGSPTFW